MPPSNKDIWQRLHVALNMGTELPNVHNPFEILMMIEIKSHFYDVKIRIKSEIQQPTPHQPCGCTHTPISRKAMSPPTF